MPSSACQVCAMLFRFKQVEFLGSSRSFGVSCMARRAWQLVLRRMRVSEHYEHFFCETQIILSCVH
jgi:hypothetical protein